LPVELRKDSGNIAVASDGTSSEADTVPGKGEEDFLAVQTPWAYSTRSLPQDHGFSDRYQAITTGVCTAVYRTISIEPWQTINNLVNFCGTVAEYLLIYLINYCNELASYTLY